MIARRYRRAAIGLVVAAIGLGLTGCSSRASDAATITYHDASGNHTVHITRTDFDDEMHQLVSNTKFTAILKEGGGYANLGGTEYTDQGLSTQWLTSLIEQVAVDTEATRDHLTIAPADTTYGTTQEGQRFTAEVFAAFPKSFADKLVERDARLSSVFRYYATCPSGRFVSHILYKTKVAADVGLRIIQAGRSFASVAKTQSTDTGSAPQGGALGCLTPSEFVPEFQNAATAAPLDVVTGPVKTQFGFHLILVRRWDSTADAAYAQALQQAAGTALTAQLNDFHVSVDPRYGTWQKVTSANGTQFAVVAPKVPALRTCREQTTTCAPPTTTTTTTTVPAGG